MRWRENWFRSSKQTIRADSRSGLGGDASPREVRRSSSAPDASSLYSRETDGARPADVSVGSPSDILKREGSRGGFAAGGGTRQGAVHFSVAAGRSARGVRASWPAFGRAPGPVTNVAFLTLLLGTFRLSHLGTRRIISGGAASDCATRDHFCCNGAASAAACAVGRLFFLAIGLLSSFLAPPAFVAGCSHGGTIPLLPPSMAMPSSFVYQARFAHTITDFDPLCLCPLLSQSPSHPKSPTHVWPERGEESYRVLILRFAACLSRLSVGRVVSPSDPCSSSWRASRLGSRSLGSRWR